MDYINLGQDRRWWGALVKTVMNLRVLWSSGQSSWLQIRRPGFDSWNYQKKK
jgi:hypothetical protein